MELDLEFREMISPQLDLIVRTSCWEISPSLLLIHWGMLVVPGLRSLEYQCFRNSVKPAYLTIPLSSYEE
jgi:hypothetical protein